MRRHLAVLVAATTALVLVAFLVPLALLVRTVVADRAVNAATTRAQSLTALVATGDRDALQATLAQTNADAAHQVTVFLSGGSVLGAPATRTAAVRLAMRGRSLSVDTATGRQILVSVQGMPAGSAVIATTVATAELHQGVTTAWLILLLLGCALIAVGVVVADWLARSMVRPMTELSDVSHRLARGDMAARAGNGGPREVREVSAALNHLAGRIRDLLQQEREDAADLSHRLRTPLTALRLGAEALHDPAEARRLGADIDTLERAVNQAIRDARRPAAAASHCDAAAVVSERVTFWSVLAEETGRDVETVLPANAVPVALPPADLAAALDALLGNVFAHTPDGTGFAVTLTARSGGVSLVVDDHGPGFADQEALHRGSSGTHSTGLGLDIAQRAARRAAGSLTMTSNAHGGARVILDIGASIS